MTKRIFDLVVSLIVILLVSPILVLGALAVFLSSPGPVLFTQVRVGRNQKSFRIFKLRTMTINPKRKLVQTQLSDSEVFWAGKILRRLKIDELPQIFNVVLGDMSLVGPRPCMAVTVEEMPDWAKQRFDLRPGLTGMAQIHGNASLTWPERWEYDVDYVKRCSLGLDLWILWRTVLVVFAGEERFRVQR